jgi:hypothetical protein
MISAEEYGAVAELVRTLKGAPSSVLWVLLLSKRPHTKTELEAATGYSDKPIKQAMDYLESSGLVRRDGNGWSLSASFQKLALSLMATEGARAQADAEGAGSVLPATVSPDGDRVVEGAGSAEGEFEQKGSDRDFSECREVSSIVSRRLSLSERMVRNYSESARNFSESNRNFSEHNRNFSESKEKIVAVVDLDQGKDQIQQQQNRPGVRNFSDDGFGDGELASLLRRMGVIGRAFERLSQRPDLLADPSVVLAWWWYYRAQEWADKPAGAVICRLEDGHTPPTGYLELARTWQNVSAEDRQEIEEMHWRGWSSGELSRFFSQSYPGMTAEAFVAFMGVYQRAPDELEIAHD